MLMISNIKRFELSASLGWVKLTRREDGEEILLYPEDALNLADWAAQNQEALPRPANVLRPKRSWLIAQWAHQICQPGKRSARQTRWSNL